MKKVPTYEDLLAENRRLAERVAYLERMLYGAKSDRLASKVPDGQPGLFDELFKEAMDEKAIGIEKVARDIEKAAQKRRAAAPRNARRPQKYCYHGLEERTTTLMPEGVDVADCDIIGKDVARILHREPARVWVEVIEHPILPAKADKNLPSPRIYQSSAATMLAQTCSRI